MTRASRRLGPDGLVLSASTLGSATPLAERIEAAARAGFAGIGLRPVDRERALADGATDADLRDSLQSADLRVVELQALGDWGLGGSAGIRSRAVEDRLYALAAALGGEYVIAVGQIEDDLVVAAERFGALRPRVRARARRRARVRVVDDDPGRAHRLGDR